MKKKKIVLLLIAAVALFLTGNMTVEALPSFSAPEKYSVTVGVDNNGNLKSTSLVGDYEIGYCTGTGPNMYYKLDGGDTVNYGSVGCTVNENTTAHAKLSLSTSLISNSAEHTIEMWISDGTNTSEKYTQEFVVISQQHQNLEDDLGVFKAKGFQFPVNSSLVATKVTDQSIINLTGSSYVYKLDVVSGGKSYKYYQDKYPDMDQNLLIDDQFYLPSGLNKGSSMKVFIYTNNFNNVTTGIDCTETHEETCDGIFEGAITKFQEMYVSFRDGNFEFRGNGTSGETVNTPDTAASQGLAIIIFAISMAILGFIITSIIIFGKNPIKEK